MLVKHLHWTFPQSVSTWQTRRPIWLRVIGLTTHYFETVGRGTCHESGLRFSTEALESNPAAVVWQTSNLLILSDSPLCVGAWAT